MRLLTMLSVICLSMPLMAQEANNAESNSGDTKLMGSGSKNVEGPAVNKDQNKYKKLESKSHQQLQEEEVGNNPTGTDTIRGKNSKKISD